MKVLTFLLRYIHYFALSLLALTMVFCPIVETRFGSNKMTVLGIAISILLAFIIHFHVMLNKLLKSGQDILNAGIGDAFREIPFYQTLAC